MGQLLLGTKRPRLTMPRTLLAALAAGVISLSAGAAGAQDERPVPVQINAQVYDSAEALFRNLLWQPVVQAKCLNCHVAGGLSGRTRLVFEVDGDAAEHAQTFADFLQPAGGDDGHELILVKIQGAGHGGGEQVAVDTNDFDNMDRFLALLENEIEAEAAFHDKISEPIAQAKCITCHVQGGFSGHTRLVLVPSTEADHEATNLQRFRNLVDAVESDGGAAYILNKVQGMPFHGGGIQLPADSNNFRNMEHFLELLEEEPQGFVARILEALEGAGTTMTFGITTPLDQDTVAGSAVAVSATEAPTEAVHFAYRPDDGSQGDFDYLGAAANHHAALYAWDTTAMTDGDYELAALYTEDEGESFTHDAIDVSVDNVDPAADADIEEDPGFKEQAVRMGATNEVVTAGGVKVMLPGAALDADDRLTLEVMDFPEVDEEPPGTAVGAGTVDVALDSGQTTLREAVTVALPYYEGRPDGIVHDTDIAETELSLWYFDTTAEAWEMVSGSTVDGDADLVSADVTQTGEYGIFHAPMMMVEDDIEEPETDMMAQVGDGGGGCTMLPMLPPGGGPPDDPTLIGLLGLVTAYLLFGRRRLRRQAAMA